MHIKRYKGHRLPDVMRQVREDLGDAAVILHTKGSPSRGVRRLMGGGGVEVVAAVDTTVDATPTAPAPREAAARPVVRSAVDVPDVAAELAALRGLILRTSGVRAVPAELGALYTRLVGRGLDEALSLRLLEGLEGDAIEYVETRLAEMIEIGDVVLPPRAVTMAVVGAAGSGKTSVIAKLAVASHVAGEAPALLTLDGSSVGATTQLETVGRIIDAPCAVTLTPGDVATALARPVHGPRLIDTPAMNLRDTDDIVKVAALLRAALPDEVHLVLPATATRNDLLRTVTAAAPFGITHVVFTRLDEAVAPGAIVAAAHAARRPLSFIGTGRDVTRDLEPAAALPLARRILHGETR